MKKLFISMLAVAALASCSQEDVIVADKGDLIGFNSFVENSTRATDPSYSNRDINTINVYGTVNNVLIYNYTPVTRPTTDKGQGYNAVWKCDVKQYWIDGASYKFIALVDVPKTDITAYDTYGMPTSFTYTADGVTDVLCDDYATTGQKTGNGTVPFTFNHLLSKVNFTVVNGTPDAEGYSFEVKNIAFNGATKATYDVVNKKWIDLTEKKATILGNERKVPVNGVETTVKDIVVASKAASAELDTEVLFLPGEYTISFTVDILYDGKLVTTTNYPVSPATYTYTLAANNAYNFKVNVAVGQLIQFTVTKQPTWEDGDGDGDTTLTL